MKFQMNSLESTYREISDIYDVNGAKGLSRSCIQKLPVHEFHSSEMIKSREESSCSICLQVRIMTYDQGFKKNINNEKKKHVLLYQITVK